MKYRVRLTPRARQELLAIPSEELSRIDAKIVSLGRNARPPGTKKLAGSEYWRVRVGDYRIVYEIDDKARSVLVLRIGHRREVYRGS